MTRVETRIASLKRFASILFAAQLALIGALAQANAIYNYVGVDFTIEGGDASGQVPRPGAVATLEFSSALPANSVDLSIGPADPNKPLSFSAHFSPLPWSISDPVSASAPPGWATELVGIVSTDTLGKISAWNMTFYQRDESGGNEFVLLLGSTAHDSFFLDEPVYDEGIPADSFSTARFGSLAPGTWTLEGSNLVPEPATPLLILIALGLMSIGKATRRNRVV